MPKPQRQNFVKFENAYEIVSELVLHLRLSLTLLVYVGTIHEINSLE